MLLFSDTYTHRGTEKLGSYFGNPSKQELSNGLSTLFSFAKHLTYPVLFGRRHPQVEGATQHLDLLHGADVTSSLHPCRLEALLRSTYPRATEYIKCKAQCPWASTAPTFPERNNEPGSGKRTLGSSSGSLGGTKLCQATFGSALEPKWHEIKGCRLTPS